MLKVDKKGNILRPDGTVLGSPKKTGGVYRAGNRTGRIDLETGDVMNLKDEIIGKVDVTKFEILAETIKKNAAKKEVAMKKAAKKSKKDVPAKQEKVEAIAPKKEEKKKEEYRPGLDSAFIVSGQFSKMYYKPCPPSAEERALAEINKKHNWKYADWNELSKKEDLTDQELEHYDLYVDWYDFLATHPDREFDEKHRKMFRSHLALRVLGLVPYNGIHTQGEAYKQSSIKEDRARAEHVKELKAKREARKKIRAEA